MPPEDGPPGLSGGGRPAPKKARLVRALPRPARRRRTGGAPGQRHRWPTWALIVVMAVAGVLGMVLGYLPDSSHSSAVAGSTGPSFPSGLGGGTVGVPTTTRARAGSSSGGTTLPVTTTTFGTHPAPPPTTGRRGTTTVAPTSGTTRPRSASTTRPRSTTTLPPTTTTLPVMRTVVVQMPQTSGSSATPEFTISHGPYEFGYAYDCQAAPTAEQSFQVSVVTSEGPSASPAVFSKKLRGTGTEAVSTTGSQKLVVETGAACQWVLKVVAP